MRITELLHLDAVLPAVTARQKNDVLVSAAARLSSCYPEIARDRLTEALVKRERLMSTALANGVAVPHARLAGISRMVAAFGRSHAGIDWDAPDGRPTRLFFLLVTPEAANGVHLRLLAAVSRLLHDDGCRARLMDAPDEMLLDVLRAEEARGVRAA